MLNLIDVMKSRYSARKFQHDRIVSDEQIELLKQSVQTVPSCFGLQPWRYIIFNKLKNKSSWLSILNLLVEKNAQWAQHCQLFIIVLHNSLHEGNENKFSAYDTGAASYALTLQAHASGLNAHQMGGFDLDKLVELLKPPIEFKPISIIAVGYPDPSEEVTSISARKPLDAMFSESQW